MAHKNSTIITEVEAVSTIIQAYLFHTSKWYSALIALVIGLLVVPLFALNASLSYGGFAFILRLLFSILTLLFLDATFYIVAKVLYSLALLSTLYTKLKIRKTGKTVNTYLIEMKKRVRTDTKTFRIYRMDQIPRYKFLIYCSFISLAVIGAILFCFIWWEYDCFVIWYFVSMFVYVITIGILLRVVQIF